jgi:hypothetical protein
VSPLRFSSLPCSFSHVLAHIQICAPCSDASHPHSQAFLLSPPTSAISLTPPPLDAASFIPWQLIFSVCPALTNTCLTLFSIHTDALAAAEDAFLSMLTGIAFDVRPGALPARWPQHARTACDRCCQTCCTDSVLPSGPSTWTCTQNRRPRMCVPASRTLEVLRLAQPGITSPRISCTRACVQSRSNVTDIPWSACEVDSASSSVTHSTALLPSSVSTYHE